MAKMIKIRVSNDVTQTVWNSFCNPLGGNIFHSYPWIMAMKQSGFVPLFFLVQDTFSRRGAMVLFIKPYRFPLLHRLRYKPFISFVGMGKPVLDDNDQEAMSALWEATHQEARKRGVLSLEWLTDFTFFHQPHLLERYGFQIIPFNTSVMDLTQDTAFLWDKLHHHKKRNIAKARKKGVVIKECEDIHIYLSLHRLISSKLKHPPHAVSRRITRIYNYLKKPGYCKVFIGYQQAKPIAGAFILLYEKCAFYLYGASQPHDPTGSSHLLHWEIIQWAKKQGLKAYDFLGIVPPQRETEDIAGVNRFKKEFNGIIYPRYGAVYIYKERHMNIVKKLTSFKKKLNVIPYAHSSP